MLDRGGFAHDRQAVAHLQTQVGGGQQLYARAVDAADVDAVIVAQAQRGEFLAVDFGARHEDALRGELAVDGVPVDVLRVPVLLFLLSEDQAQRIGLARGGDHEDDVVLLQRLVGGGNRNLPFAPDPRNDEVVVALRSDLVDAFAEDGRVGQVVAGDEDVFPVFGVRLRHVGGADEELADEDDGQDDAHHAQRIGHGAAQGGAAGVDAHLLQRLLRRSERRGVGRGAAQDARHVGHRDVQRIAHCHGQPRAEQYYRKGGRHQAQSVGAQRVEEAGADLQAEGVYEDDEPEALGIVQHRRVDRQSEMPGQDPCEKDECHAQRDAEDAYPAEGDPDRRNERNNHDGLQGRVFDE